MKKGSNVVEYAILATVVGLALAMGIHTLMDDGAGNNRLRNLFSQANQIDDDGSRGVTVPPITD